MVRVLFDRTLTPQERAEIQNIIIEFISYNRDSPAAASVVKRKYELVSVQSAKTSRLRKDFAGGISVFDDMVLRMYGSFGLVINQARREYSRPNFETPASFGAAARTRVRDELSSLNIMTRRDLDIPGRIVDDHVTDRLLLDPDSANSITRYVDDIITRNGENDYQDYSYFYRSVFPLDGVYAGAAGGNSIASPIVPGDVIVDEALMSTATTPEAVLHRYASRQGVTVAHMDLSKRENIIYAIQYRDHLPSMDISGFKFEQHHLGDRATSGERLIRSRQPFRVRAVQRAVPDSDVRVVVLEPMRLADVDFMYTRIRNADNGQDARDGLRSRLRNEAPERPRGASASVVPLRVPPRRSLQQASVEDRRQQARLAEERRQQASLVQDRRRQESRAEADALNTPIDLPTDPSTDSPADSGGKLSGTDEFEGSVLDDSADDAALVRQSFSAGNTAQARRRKSSSQATGGPDQAADGFSATETPVAAEVKPQRKRVSDPVLPSPEPTAIAGQSLDTEVVTDAVDIGVPVTGTEINEQLDANNEAQQGNSQQGNLDTEGLEETGDELLELLELL
ncbi:MAG: hypothetical protein ACR2PW_01050 [Gammaproteobacteria bacterium]